jgi:hypothetical protein
MDAGESKGLAVVYGDLMPGGFERSEIKNEESYDFP